jgi:hypothetical protein
MRKHRKRATTKSPTLPPAFNDDPAHDDPHDAIEQELLGIWLSISRLRDMMWDKPAAADGRVIPLWPRGVSRKPPPRKSTQKRPRRRAA